MDAICLLLLLSSQLRLSFVSVVFDFNASLNDVAPLSSMLLPFDLMRMERVDCWWISFVCCFFCFHNTD